MTPMPKQQIDAQVDDPGETPLPQAMRPRTLFLLLLLLLVVAPGSLIYRYHDFLERDQEVVHRQALTNGFVIEQRESRRTFVCDEQRRACILAQQPVKAP